MARCGHRGAAVSPLVAGAAPIKAATKKAVTAMVTAALIGLASPCAAQSATHDASSTAESAATASDWVGQPDSGSTAPASHATDDNGASRPASPDSTTIGQALDSDDTVSVPPPPSPPAPANGAAARPVDQPAAGQGAAAPASTGGASARTLPGHISLPAGSADADGATLQKIVARLVETHALASAADAGDATALGEALRSFQHAAGLAETGILDGDTLARLAGN